MAAGQARGPSRQRLQRAGCNHPFRGAGVASPMQSRQHPTASRSKQVFMRHGVKSSEQSLPPAAAPPVPPAPECPLPLPLPAPPAAAAQLPGGRRLLLQRPRGAAGGGARRVGGSAPEGGWWPDTWDRLHPGLACRQDRGVWQRRVSGTVAMHALLHMWIHASEQRLVKQGP